jgi:hypothetical protein
MPYDRRPSNTGRPARPARSSGSKPGRSGAGASRGQSGRGSTARAPRPTTHADGRPATSKRYDRDGARSGAPRRSSAKRDPRATPAADGDRPRRYDSSRTGGRDRVPPRRVERPKTAAQIRSAEVKAQRGLREPREKAEPPPWEREQWIDEGPMRSAARQAASRAQQPKSPMPRALDGDGRRWISLQRSPRICSEALPRHGPPSTRNDWRRPPMRSIEPLRRCSANGPTRVARLA